MPKEKLEKLFDLFFICLLFILIIGIPLAFTSLTRSVFEVNKLLLLRVVSISVYFAWFFRYILFKANGIDNPKEGSLSVLGLRWQKIGLEIPLLLWTAINILSTIFAQNLAVAIIGAYDRWEGIVTIINYVLLILMYAKLVKKPAHLHWLIGGMIGSTALSAGYGVFQSLGYDFMSWSVDPTMRVFACINNPVHFCAYVAMVVPVALGWLLYIAHKEEQTTRSPLWLTASKWVVFLLTVLIYYSQFLSYSRATWMGFIGAMTLFYLVVTENFNQKSEKSFLLDMFATFVGVSIFYLIAIFNYNQKGLLIGGVLWLAVIAYLVYAYYATNAYQDSTKLKQQTVVGLALCFFAFICDLQILNQLVAHLPFLIYVLFAGAFVFFAQKIKGNSRYFFARIVLILIFAKLQFVAVSWTSIISYFVLIAAYYFLSLKDEGMLSHQKKFWLTLFLLIFGVVLAAPTIPGHIARLSPLKSDTTMTVGLKASTNAESKVDSYKKVALEGTARTSMWKSAIPWIKDYWLLGTGPDTVKYMYPKYRRPEYGKLEGGHNFTPDRLHNEYLNTLATRGILGGIVYYVGVILGWYILIFKGLYRFRKNPMVYIVTGIMAGATVYMGQVMFNFGVVATLFLFYTLLGLGLAVIYHPAFGEEE